MTPNSVSPRDARRRLGKTFYMPVQGREVTVDAARAVGKHPEPISPSRDRFALFGLCKVGSDLALERGLGTDPNGAPNQYVLARLIFV